MSRIHATAASGFGRGALDYERGRPGYPAEVVALAASELGVGPGRRIVDLAAGTGKLTRVLVGRGAEVVAVEPVAAMREQLALAVSGVTILDGTAERIPLGDGSVHAVFVAQAFHWFDVPAAAAEISRVLDDDGGLAIVRNRWDDSGPPWVSELGAFIHGHARRPSTHGRDWRAQLDATGRFAPFRERTVPNPVVGDVAWLRLRVASMSYIAALPDDEREALVDDAVGLLARHGIAPGDELVLPLRTQVLWARRA